jgi:Nif-specific regulatory protein
MEYDYPGNVRELENLIERAVVLAHGQPLTQDLLGFPGRAERRLRPRKPGAGIDLPGLIQQLVRVGIQTLPSGTLEQRIVRTVERELIEQVLIQCNNVQVKAAERLGINRNTLHKKLAEYDGMNADGANHDE